MLTQNSAKKEPQKEEKTKIMPVNEIKQPLRISNLNNQVKTKSKLQKNLKSNKTEENKKEIQIPKSQIKKRVKCNLTENEKKIYGNRCPHGYKKVQLLGKGG